MVVLRRHLHSSWWLASSTNGTIRMPFMTSFTSPAPRKKKDLLVIQRRERNGKKREVRAPRFDLNWKRNTHASERTQTKIREIRRGWVGYYRSTLDTQRITAENAMIEKRIVRPKEKKNCIHEIMYTPEYTNLLGKNPECWNVTRSWIQCFWL